MDKVRVYLGRVIGALVAGASIWIGNTIGVAWAPTADEQTWLTGLLTAGAFALALTLYSVVHRWIDGIINPADAAKPEEAALSAARAKAQSAAKGAS